MKKTTLNVNSSELQTYLKEIKKISLISLEKQNEIFDKLLDENTTEQEKIKLKNEIVSSNLRFVVSVAKSYQNQGLDLSDLIAEGNIGLLKAIDRFNPKSGLKFISYAVWWVKQSIMAALNEYSRTIRLPSNLVQEMQKNNKKKSNTLDENYILELTDENLSEYPYCIDLYKEINDTGDLLIDVIPDPNQTTAENKFDHNQDLRDKIDSMLSVLDERERVIIEKYFGLNGIESNLDDLGEEFDCTKERIRQLKDKSIKKLRNESYHLINNL